MFKTCLLSAGLVALGICASHAQGPQFDASRYDTPRFGSPPLASPRFRSAQLAAPQLGAPQFDASQYDATPYETTPYETTPYEAPQLSGPSFGGPSPAGPGYGPENYQDAAPIPSFTPPQEPGLIMPGPGGPIVAPQLDAEPMPLGDCHCQFFKRVKYRNKRKISPCAQTMVVSVVDPCTRRWDCAPRCVQVKICVPTCGCPQVKIRRNGRHTRYDYGKYAVDIFSNRNGTITVDYDA